jgi:hypothetical protein
MVESPVHAFAAVLPIEAPISARFSNRNDNGSRKNQCDTRHLTWECLSVFTTPAYPRCGEVVGIQDCLFGDTFASSSTNQARDPCAKAAAGKSEPKA